MATFVAEMCLFDAEGHRLYLNADERQRFLKAAEKMKKAARMLCHFYCYTGCRRGEALLVKPRWIDLDKSVVQLQTLKKERLIKKGKR